MVVFLRRCHCELSGESSQTLLASDDSQRHQTDGVTSWDKNPHTSHARASSPSIPTSQMFRASHERVSSFFNRRAAAINLRLTCTTSSGSRDCSNEVPNKEEVSGGSTSSRSGADQSTETKLCPRAAASLEEPHDAPEGGFRAANGLASTLRVRVSTPRTAPLHLTLNHGRSFQRWFRRALRCGHRLSRVA